MARRTMLYPSVDYLQVDPADDHCEMCNLWFPAGTSWEARQEHDIRCLDAKVEEHRQRTAMGQRLTSRGWVYEDGRLV